MASQDPFLEPFRSLTFDPIIYLNGTLPPLQPQSQSQSQPQTAPRPSTVPLSTLLEHSSSLLARLSAQSSLTSDTLTSLTDEILRGGARLAFEVEVLRSEVVGLEDVWSAHASSLPAIPTSTSSDPQSISIPVPPSSSSSLTESNSSERALSALETQSLVRTHLESVRRTFDLALSFPLPPQSVLQQLSIAQGGAPDLGSYAYSSSPKLPPPYLPASLLEPLQAFLSLPLPSNVSVRTPTSANVNASASANVVVGPKLEAVHAVELSLEKAVAALDAADKVCEVWRGTGEEKVRRAVVELWRVAVSERRDVERRSGRVRDESVEKEDEVQSGEMGQSPEKEKVSGIGNPSAKGLAGAGTVGASAAKGLLSGLRRLRDEIYLE